MKAVGLRLLEASCILSVFEHAQLVCQQLEVRLVMRQFIGVNTTKGAWLLLEHLMSSPQAHATQDSPGPRAIATSVLLPAHMAIGSDLNQAPPPCGLISAFTLDEARRLVLAAVQEVLGEGCHIGVDGQFSPGEFLSFIEASSISFIEACGLHAMVNWQSAKKQLHC